MDTPVSKPESKLSGPTKYLMIAVALFYDVLSLVPGLNFIVAFFAGFHFWFWFKLKGISFVSPKRLVVGSTGFVAEMIPVLSSLPAWTGIVVFMILDTKIKETVGL